MRCTGKRAPGRPRDRHAGAGVKTYSEAMANSSFCVQVQRGSGSVPEGRAAGSRCAPAARRGYARRHDEAAQLLPLLRLFPRAHRAAAQGPALRLRARAHRARRAPAAGAYRGASRPTRWCRCSRRTTASTSAQSMAIIEYLDETHPEPALLPRDRARPRPCARAGADRSPARSTRSTTCACSSTWCASSRSTTTPRTPGTATGCATAWKPSSASWPCCAGARSRGQAVATAGATRPRWPTAAWCRRSSTRQRFDCDLNGLPRTMAAFDACMQLEPSSSAQPSRCPDAEA